MSTPLTLVKARDISTTAYSDVIGGKVLLKNADRTAITDDESQQNIGRCGFVRTVWLEQAAKFSPLNIKRQAAQGIDRTVAFPEITDFEQGHR